ncbi:ABC transporter ATP-binding protein [Abyssisolibacter fermentans]|uniref:ABC transporter ATP-binding protein n=1 Tax=Abyssisolibacter fermentans TaxID=1766203 RepID=UPI00082E3A8A|nr:ABC transporter ATP-binding protein [Abyssisolibacter fermentans]
MQKQRSLFQNIKRLIKIYNQKLLLSSIVFIVLSLSAVEVIFSILLKSFLDESVVSGDKSYFYYRLYLVLLVLFVQLILRYLNTRLTGKWTERGILTLRKKAVQKLCYLPISELENKHSSKYISRMTNDIKAIEKFTKQVMIRLLSIPLTLVCVIILLFYLSWQLTLVTIIEIPILFFGTSLLNKPILKLSKELYGKLDKISLISQDTILGMEIAHVFNILSKLNKRYSDTVDDTIRIQKKLAKRKSIIEGFSLIVRISPFVISVGFGSYLVINDELSVGGLLVFMYLLNNLTFPVGALPGLISEANTCIAAFNRICEILDSRTENYDHKLINVNLDCEEVITFKNVSFSYNDEKKKILDNVSFSVKKGESIGLVGPSGSGKSSILKLIQGYYENYEGTIKVFGIDIRSWNKKQLNQLISLVSQDTYLFPYSLKENIGYGKINATDEEIINASKMANANDFIVDFPAEYDTNAGEIGGKLSGGQRQRISIARAILKNAPLLLLDEVTSALDVESQTLVQEALDDFIKKRTAISVTHRYDTIKNTTKIFVIDDSRIVEEGNHKELLSKDGLYKKLYEEMTNVQEELLVGGVE